MKFPIKEDCKQCDFKTGVNDDLAFCDVQNCDYLRGAMLRIEENREKRKQKKEGAPNG